MGKELVKKEGADVVEEQQKPIEVSGKLDISQMVKSFGQIKLTKEQKDVLFADPDDKDVEIRPDGLVYLPWVFYHDRLREVFGWEYAIIPKGDPRYIERANIVVWGFYMVIKGSLMAYAVGENPYYPNNPKMSAVFIWLKQGLNHHRHIVGKKKFE